MIYLITQLAGWLLLTMAFAALAGWVYAAVRAQPEESARQRERERLVRDLGVLAAEAAPAGNDDHARELDALRGRLDVEASRVAHAERALEAARSRAEEAVSQAAALQRALEERHPELELTPPREEAIEVVATPVRDDDAALQAWRLRYFEQRVRFLETPRPATATAAPKPLEWRARVAEARAEHLEQELRDTARGLTSGPAAEPVSAFAADVETDALLRWRMLYLERRVAHLQAETAEPAAPPTPARAPATDPGLWKWRARYLEARVRHLETRPATHAVPLAALAPAQADEPPLASGPTGPAERPPTLAVARGGAPDDLRLIEGVTLLRQTTLHALGIFHFDQIAGWTPANVAWVDRYFRLLGRIGEEEWVEQAIALARDGVAAARRGAMETEPA